MKILFRNSNNFWLFIFFFNCVFTISMITGDDVECTQIKLGQVKETMEDNYKILEEKILKMESKLDKTMEILLQMERNMQESLKTQKLLQCIMDQTPDIHIIERRRDGDIVVQRRQDGSEDFFRTWAEYKNGFGNSSGEFFIGLEALHKLTNSQPHELFVVMEHRNSNDRLYAKYDHFVIGSEEEKYVLKSLGKFSGTDADIFEEQLGKKFSTKDQDNDTVESLNCALECYSAWWYGNCEASDLNGRYFKGLTPVRGGNTERRQRLACYGVLLKFVEVIIRPSCWHQI